MRTCTGWARDGRPRAPRFGFLFFPPSFSCSFPFPFVVSFSLSFLFLSFFFLFSRVFFGCLSLLTVLSFRLLPRSPPLVSVPCCIHSPRVRLARWQQRGHIAPPFHRDEEGHLLPPLVRFFFFSFSLFFHFVSGMSFLLFFLVLVLMPFPLLSQVHDGPLSLANAAGGSIRSPSGSSPPSFTLFAPVRPRPSSRLFALSRLFTSLLLFAPRAPRLLATKRVASPLPPLVRGSLVCLVRSFLSRVRPSLIFHAFLLMSSPLSQVRDGPLSLANTTWGSIRSPPSGSSFPRLPPSLVAFVRPACALVAGDEEGVWPRPPSHPRSPSFVLVCLARWRRRGSPLPFRLWFGFLFGLAFVFVLGLYFFCFFSHRLVLMPFPALSQVHDGPLSLANTSGGSISPPLLRAVIAHCSGLFLFSLF
jgi:hypothetical protein